MTRSPGSDIRQGISKTNLECGDRTNCGTAFWTRYDYRISRIIRKRRRLMIGTSYALPAHLEHLEDTP